MLHTLRLIFLFDILVAHLAALTAAIVLWAFGQIPRCALPGPVPVAFPGGLLALLRTVLTFPFHHMITGELRILLHKAIVNFDAEFIGVAKAVQVWLQFFDEVGEVRLKGHLKGFLDHIVAILVQQELVEGVCREDFEDHGLLDLWAVVLEALLDHIGRELFLPENEKRAQELLADLLVDLNALQLEYILHHVVPVRVLNESLRVLRYLKSKRQFLLGVRPVYAFLHHTAAVLVARYLLALLDHGLIDELVEFGFPSLQNLLNHMVPVNVLCQLSHSILQI